MNNIRYQNFSELDRVDNEGNLLIFEPKTGDDDCFKQSDHIPGFWFKVCSQLSGLETIVIFLLYGWDMTQGEVADYLNISRSYVAKIVRKARNTLCKSEYLLKLIGNNND